MYDPIATLNMPTDKITYFIAFCIEQYKTAKGMKGEDVSKLFFDKGVVFYGIVGSRNAALARRGSGSRAPRTLHRVYTVDGSLQSQPKVVDALDSSRMGQIV